METDIAIETDTDLFDVYIYYKPFYGEWHIAIVPHGAEWFESNPSHNRLYRGVAMTKSGARRKARRACKVLVNTHNDPFYNREKWVFSKEQ